MKKYLFLLITIFILPFFAKGSFSQPSFIDYYTISSQDNHSSGYNPPLWGGFSQTLSLPSAPMENTPTFTLKMSAVDLGLGPDCKLFPWLIINTTIANGSYSLHPPGYSYPEGNNVEYFVGGSNYASHPNNLVGRELTVPFTTVGPYYGGGPLTNQNQLTQIYFAGLQPTADSPSTCLKHNQFFDSQWVDAAVKVGYGEDVLPGTQNRSAHQIVNTVEQFQDNDLTFSFGTIQPSTKTPVLIVPGVLGSDILKGDSKLWLDLEHNFSDSEDQFMDDLEFTDSLDSLEPALSLGNIVDKRSVNVGVGKVTLFDYSYALTQSFIDQNYIEGTGTNATLFTFPYDWRYGVSGSYPDGKTNVDLLKLKIEEIKQQTGSDKVDVIAHSTGGLLVKKYIIDNQSSHNLDKAVFVGVPNLGSPKAIKALLEGDQFGVPFLNAAEMEYLSKNLPVVYDLAPSQQYFNLKGSYFQRINQSLTTDIQDLNFNQTNNFLVIEHGMNTLAIVNSQNFHSASFDSFNLSTTGVDAYNIVGCKSPTIGKIKEVRYGGIPGPAYLAPDEISGDRTVPFESADSINAPLAKSYYAVKADHGTMLSANGIRQQIVNIIAGSTLPVGSNIITKQDLIADPNKCKLKGHWWQIFSPVNIEVIDQDGNRSGPAEDGSIQNDIPGAAYEVFGDHKFVFAPTDEGQVYTVKLKGTGVGTFTFKDETIDNSQTVETKVFSDLPVTPNLSGQVNLGSTITLSLDNDGNGTVDQTIQPTSTLNPDQSQDVLAPVSTSTITGTLGQPGFYRSNVSVSLDSVDPVISGQESQTSGVLNTQYSLDGGPYMPYSSSSPISLITEGAHTVAFFSTDKAGNNEGIKTISFVIDKTAPEFNMQFSLGIKDLLFSGKDNISTSSDITILDTDDVVSLTDQAGNVTKLTFLDKDRKKRFKAEIKSLAYNGVAADISKTVLRFNWEFDKQGQLKKLGQHIKSKKEFNIDADYKPNQTKLTGRDKSGKINLTLNGLVSLKVSTDKGDFSWSY